MDRVAKVIMSVCPRFNIGGGRDGANLTLKASYKPSADETDDAIQQEVRRVYNVVCTWLLPNGVPEEPSADDPIVIGGYPDGATWITISPDLLTAIQ